MQGLREEQSSVPEDRMERGLLARGNLDIGLRRGEEEKLKKDGCHISIRKLL
jgi:hypothetical protein